MAELEKNVDFVWVFKMVDATNFATAEDSLDVGNFDISVSKDGAAFAAAEGSPSVTAISNGFYTVTIDQVDMNADVVVLRATNTGGAAAPSEEKLYPPTKIVSDLSDFNQAVEVVTLDPGSVTDTVFSASGANFLADHIIRRTCANVEGSTNGDDLSFRSLYGAIAKLVNFVRVIDGTLEVKQSNDTTNIGTQAVTSSSSADPITALDTII